MKKYRADEKKVHIYPILDDDGTELDLMNILTYKTGELDRVDTFIGRHDRDEYVKVGSSKGWSEPGVIGGYSSFVQSQESLIGMYIEIYHDNLHGKRYTENGPYFIR